MFFFRISSSTFSWLKLDWAFSTILWAISWKTWIDTAYWYLRSRKNRKQANVFWCLIFTSTNFEMSNGVFEEVCLVSDTEKSAIIVRNPRQSLNLTSICVRVESMKKSRSETIWTISRGMFSFKLALVNFMRTECFSSLSNLSTGGGTPFILNECNYILKT